MGMGAAFTLYDMMYNSEWCRSIVLNGYRNCPLFTPVAILLLEGYHEYWLVLNNNNKKQRM